MLSEERIHIDELRRISSERELTEEEVKDQLVSFDIKVDGEIYEGTGTILGIDNKINALFRFDGLLERIKKRRFPYGFLYLVYVGTCSGSLVVETTGIEQHVLDYGQKYLKITDHPALQQINKSSERQLIEDRFYKAKIKNLKGGGRLMINLLKEDQTGFDLMVKHTRGLSSETWKLLDFGLMKINRKGVRRLEDLEVTFSLPEYLQWKGLKDTKDSRKAVKNRLDMELNLLWNAYCETSNNGKCRIIGRYDLPRGHVRFRFDPDMLKFLIESTYLICHQDIYQLDSYRHPHGYYLGRKLSEHKRMNYNKPNADIINVKTLLEICPELPVYDEAMKKQGQLRQLIIEPFERDLDALTFLTWSYVTDTGKAVERTSRMTYQRFITLRVKVEWKDYPEKLLPTRREMKQIGEHGEGGGHR